MVNGKCDIMEIIDCYRMRIKVDITSVYEKCLIYKMSNNKNYYTLFLHALSTYSEIQKYKGYFKITQ